MVPSNSKSVSVPLRGLVRRKVFRADQQDIAAEVSVPLRGLVRRKGSAIVASTYRAGVRVSVPLRGLVRRKGSAIVASTYRAGVRVSVPLRGLVRRKVVFAAKDKQTAKS